MGARGYDRAYIYIYILLSYVYSQSPSVLSIERIFLIFKFISVKLDLYSH